MERFILKGEDPKIRLSYLQDSCDGVEERPYYKRLDEMEMAQKRIEFTNNALRMADIEDRKKDFLAELKEEMDPLKKRYAELSGEVRTGFAEVKGKLYKFIDHDTKMVVYYTEEGELIDRETRPATKDELAQMRISFNSKTGTED